tara:strand:+ start:1360 stop:1488 length:129 start_codon:yes stop_codon:yes gene_type:complete
LEKKKTRKFEHFKELSLSITWSGNYDTIHRVLAVTAKKTSND